MKPHVVPSKEYLESILDYYPETGKLFWKPRPGNTKGERIFNSRFAGKEAGSIRHSPEWNLSYRNVGIGDKLYPAARLILSMLGASESELLEGEADHINGDGLDNRAENLRLVSKQVNCMNRTKRKDNKSGHTGVYYCKAAKRWVACVSIDKKPKTLGYFKDKIDAINSVMAARATEKYSERHGL